MNRYFMKVMCVNKDANWLAQTRSGKLRGVSMNEYYYTNISIHKRNTVSIYIYIYYIYTLVHHVRAIN